MMDKIQILNNNYNIHVTTIEKNEESTDGNVYILKNDQTKYVMKIYESLEHTKMMVSIHNLLRDLYIPRIVKTVDNRDYINLDNKYAVMYTFLNGNQICEIDFGPLIPSIARAVRKMHSLVNCNDINIKKVPFEVDESLRSSILHFDLTKNNIFYDDGKIGFIDFDDAKFGPAICEISIIVSLLFISKKRGINREGIKTFIESYYENEPELKKQELKYLKEYALKWLDYLLKNNEFDTSLKSSFENKRNCWKII